MLKNLFLYRLGPDWPTSAYQLESAIEFDPFQPCPATSQQSCGWVPPRGEEVGPLVEVVDGQWIAKFAIETRSVPADALRKRVDKLAEEIERNTGRKPGKKELRELRDDALIALLPQAFPKTKYLTVWINPKTRIMAIDATTNKSADEAVTSLVNRAGLGFSIGLLPTAVSPRAVMTAWLDDPDGDSRPDAFDIGRECELKGMGDEPARVRFDRHSIETQEVRTHIAEGKLPTRLALEWEGRVSFVLTQELQIKKIELIGVDMAEHDADEDRFDADVAILTGELTELIDDLIYALGGEEADNE